MERIENSLCEGPLLSPMVLLSGARDPSFKDLGVSDKGKLGDVGIFACVNLPNPTVSGMFLEC